MCYSHETGFILLLIVILIDTENINSSLLAGGAWEMTLSKTAFNAIRWGRKSIAHQTWPVPSNAFQNFWFVLSKSLWVFVTLLNQLVSTVWCMRFGVMAGLLNRWSRNLITIKPTRVKETTWKTYCGLRDVDWLVLWGAERWQKVNVSDVDFENEQCLFSLAH